MKSLTLILLPLLCAGLVSCGKKSAASGSVKAEVGKAAPDFEFTDLATEKQVKLSDFKGKVVMAKFWWSKCAVCNDKMDHLQTFIGEHPEWKDDVVYLAVSIDPTIGAAKRHIAKVETEEDRSWSRTTNTWHNSKGGQSPTYLAYAAEIGVPVSYVIDRKGKIVAIDSITSEEELDLAKALREVVDAK